MNRAFLVVLAFVACAVPVAQAGYVTAQVDIMIRDYSKHPRAAGEVDYISVFGYPTPADVSFSLQITNTSASTFGEGTTPLYMSAEGDTEATNGSCYEAVLTANSIEQDSSNATATSNICYWAPQPQVNCLLTIYTSGSGSTSAYSSQYYACGTQVSLTAVPAQGWQFAYWSGDQNGPSATIQFALTRDMTVTANFTPAPATGSGDGDAFAQCGGVEGVNQCAEPIIIDLDGSANYSLTGADSPVTFDINATGTPAVIGWTAANSNVAFLWLDRNGDGVVNDGSELFGTAAPLADGRRAPNGFAALARYDDNGDGVIDEHDAIWPQLRLWRDLNHDGLSQPNEISSLAESGVTAIATGFHIVGRRDAAGNFFRFASRVWLANPNGHAVPRTIYDVFFVMRR